MSLAGQRYTRRQGALDDERCVECGAAIPGVKAPLEVTGSLVCGSCARAQGLPTWALWPDEVCIRCRKRTNEGADDGLCRECGSLVGGGA